MTTQKRIAVVYGGASSEAAVSEKSGDRVARALPRDRYSVLPVRIAGDARWDVGVRFVEPDEPAEFPGIFEPSPETRTPAESVARALSRFAESGIDVAFVALHGIGGEDGTIQGLFETARIPYTGSGVAASALAMDKWRSRGVFAGADIPIARGILLDLRSTTPSAIESVVAVIGFPCVVKPRWGGSSVGISIASSREDLARSLRTAAANAEDVVVEEHVSGRELTCGVIGNARSGSLRALPVTEIRPVGSDFFDYRAKYTLGAAEELTPAPIDDEAARQMKDIAVRAHRALGCDGFSRTDAILRDEQFHVLETNTIPGLTDNSLLPQQAAAAGLSFPALLDEIVRLALERFAG
ncbi:MAG: D-alanine--D-alanine ligase [Planctomycetes bacterium]|nr:D-alanine--D-alanine ligase [Planctomycetota bacterium]MBI3844650.1 D-alanine--D-alanine ligase [Planctomycetota bacterium]